MKLILGLLVFFTSMYCHAGIDANGHFDNADTFWTETHFPAAATKATISRAAESGKRHVVKCVKGIVVTDATAQTPVYIQLKDGSTVLDTWPVSAPATGQGGISQCDHTYIGTANTAMTIEFSAAGVSLSRESVSIQGYTIR